MTKDSTRPSPLDSDAISRWSRLVSGETRVAIAQSPKTAIYERDQLTVYRYERETPALYATPILLVYSLINRPSVLDLLPHRSVVQNLLSAGFEVYLLDWGVPDELDYDTDLHIYLDLRLHGAVKAVCRHSEQPSINVLGYCMGGTLSAMYTALHPQRVRSLVMLAAPVVFRSEQLLYQWGCDPKTCRPAAIADACGNAPPWAFDGFALLRSEGRVHRWADLYDKIDDEAYVEQHLAMDEWVYTNIPMAGAVYVEFIQKCFHQNMLAEGKLEVAGRPVLLNSISCPTLVIAGQADHLVPPETAIPLVDMIPGARKIEFKAGHVGLTVSRGANQKLWPEAAQWMADQSVKA